MAATRPPGEDSDPTRLACATVADVIGTVSRLVQAGAGRGVTTVLDLGDLPDQAQVRMDPIALHRVLLNLLVNACDAMHGQGTLTIRAYATSRATVTPVWGTVGPGPLIVIDIRDTGPGIAPHLLGKLFANPVTTKGSQGSGFGLTYVGAAVPEAGGAIGLTSSPGAGTVVHLLLRPW